MDSLDSDYPTACQRQLVLRCTLFQVSLASDAGRSSLELVATLIAGAALLSSAGARKSHAAERLQHHAIENSRAKVLMTASSGMDCVVRLAPSRRFTVTERRISEKPGHGTVTIEGETAFDRSVPGYRVRIGSPQKSARRDPTAKVRPQLSSTSS